MATLGVFRDDLYNVTATLPLVQYKTTTQNGGVFTATQMAGGQDTYLAASTQTTAQSITTDTAINLINYIDQITPSEFSIGTLQGFSWVFTIVNNNTSSGAITLSAGTGVTLVAGAAVAVAGAVEYQCTITSPTQVTIQRLASKSA